MTTRSFPAHAIKPGDRINGIAVFDLARPALRGGFFFPMEDGSRVAVKTLDDEVEIDN